MSIRALVAVSLVAAVLTACSGELRQVVTNSGGVLDCDSDTILYVVLDTAVDVGGAPTAASALDLIGADSGRPQGDPTPEGSDEEAAVFTFRDDEGNRVGRVMVSEHPGGWFVQSTERCG